MLSKEYKESVMERLGDMNTKELVILLEKVGSTRVMYSSQFDVSTQSVNYTSTPPGTLEKWTDILILVIIKIVDVCMRRLAYMPFSAFGQDPYFFLANDVKGTVARRLLPSCVVPLLYSL